MKTREALVEKYLEAGGIISQYKAPLSIALTQADSLEEARIIYHTLCEFLQLVHTHLRLDEPRYEAELRKILAAPRANT